MKMSLGVPAVAMSIRMSAVHCREHFTDTTKLLSDMGRHCGGVLDMAEDVRIAVEEGEPGLAVHFFQATATIIDMLKSRVEGITVRSGQLTTSLNKVRSSFLLFAFPVALSSFGCSSILCLLLSLNKAIGLARLGGQMTDLMSEEGNAAPLGVRRRASAARYSSGGDSSDSSDDERDAVGSDQSSRISFPGTPRTLDTPSVAAAAQPMLSDSVRNVQSAVLAAAARGTELTDEEMLELCFPMLQIGSTLGNFGAGAATRSDSEGRGMMRSSSASSSEGALLILFVCAILLFAHLFFCLLYSFVCSKGAFWGDSESGAEESAASASTEPATTHAVEPGTRIDSTAQRQLYDDLHEAANKLQEVDGVLQEVRMFWTMMQTAMETLLNRNEYVAGMLHFTRNAKMRSRYLERMDDYLAKWKVTGLFCNDYLALTSASHRSPKGLAFSFLNTPYRKAETRSAPGRFDTQALSIDKASTSEARAREPRVRSIATEQSFM
jgi:hypothetical protein